MTHSKGIFINKFIQKTVTLPASNLATSESMIKFQLTLLRQLMAFQSLSFFQGIQRPGCIWERLDNLILPKKHTGKARLE